jgi:hypothetical protein
MTDVRLEKLAAVEELRASVDAIQNTASSVSTGKSCVLVVNIRERE